MFLFEDEIYQFRIPYFGQSGFSFPSVIVIFVKDHQRIISFHRISHQLPMFLLSTNFNGVQTSACYREEECAMFCGFTRIFMIFFTFYFLCTPSLFYPPFAHHGGMQMGNGWQYSFGYRSSFLLFVSIIGLQYR
jgi:hypothetical protein